MGPPSLSLYWWLRHRYASFMGVLNCFKMFYIIADFNMTKLLGRSKQASCYGKGIHTEIPWEQWISGCLKLLKNSKRDGRFYSEIPEDRDRKKWPSSIGERVRILIDSPLPKNFASSNDVSRPVYTCDFCRDFMRDFFLFVDVEEWIS